METLVIFCPLYIHRECICNNISNPSEHIFPDCPIIVREDEPSSIIAFALSSSHYIQKLQSMRTGTNIADTKSSDLARHSIDFDDVNPTDIEETLLRETGTHIRYRKFYYH
jgi:1-phosphatidylinositol-3-phosphate 5-kinase